MDQIFVTFSYKPSINLTRTAIIKLQLTIMILVKFVLMVSLEVRGLAAGSL